jgi:CubicO group peptidase (beta-lactamase class C family)
MRGIFAVVLALTPGLAAQVRVGAEFLASVDAVFPAQLGRFHIPGAVFGLVEAERTTLKGWGVADLTRGEPVHPQRTLFCVASLTKALTAVAVLQLVEQGRAELDQDVNRWLAGWQLVPPGGGTVTLHHLLTHTAGLDERNLDRACRVWNEAPELGGLLRRTAPPFAFAPGEVCSYSNWGFFLLGHVVERETGLPFRQYVAEQVFAPLGMANSTLRLPETWRARAATGYDWRSGQHVAQAPLLDVGDAAAMLTTTAEDYCRFVAALLRKGERAESRQDHASCLRPASVARMLARQFTHDPRLGGATYGFFERFHNGHRVLEHSGHVPGFVSQVCLLPDDGIGFFFSYNSDSGYLRLALLDHLLDQLLGPPEPRLADPRPEPGDPRMVGTWRSTVYSRATIEKVMSLFGQFELHAGPDGRHYLWNEPMQVVGPDCLQPADGRLYSGPGPVVFDFDREPARFYLGPLSYERVPWFETAGVQLVALATLVVVFALAVLGWPLGTLVTRMRRRAEDGAARSARRWAWLASGCNLVFSVAAAVFVQDAMGNNGGEFVYGVPMSIRLLLLLPLTSAALTVAACVATVRAWRRSVGTGFARVQLTLVTLACLLFLAMLQLWNLLGCRW